jgi:citrate lyase subunit beta/citryl-CoA lyase
LVEEVYQMNTKTQAGRKGPDVRSDCWVEIELKDKSGISINLNSKVDSMYGQSTKELVLKELEFFKIKDADVTIEDFGALPFVISARLETALRRAIPQLSQEYLPEMHENCTYKTTRDRFRRSRLYLPGNEPKFMINAGIHKPDGIILDLEDSVAPREKDAATILVRNALRQVNFHGAERMVRINQLPNGLEDLKFIVPHNVHVILIPKCESAGHILEVDEEIKRISKTLDNPNEIFYMPIIESALGVLKAYEIAKASKNVVALTIGLEDYTADIGTQRTQEGFESFWARSMIVHAARAAGVQPIDTVYSDVTDMEGLRHSVIEAKSIGFEGRGCIHPRQIKVIHEALAPSDYEIDRAKKIVLAYEKAEKEGLGVVALGNKMIDPPVVKRAIRTIKLAIATHKLEENWQTKGNDNEQ